MTPVISPEPPSERKETAQGEAIGAFHVKSIVCPVCRAPRPKTRGWALYCSDRCRKAAYHIRKQSETPADIRATLNRIESRLAAIEARLGINL